MEIGDYYPDPDITYFFRGTGHCHDDVKTQNFLPVYVLKISGENMIRYDTKK